MPAVSTRRQLALGATGTALATALPMPAIAENRPVKIGLLTVKTGPLAQGGFQMEQGTTLFLKHSASKLADRPAELIIADTGGQPGRHEDQGAGADRARPGRHDLRAARRLRTSCDQ
jgi:hypothetical protein